MSTIKIDKGFTQRIQHTANTHALPTPPAPADHPAKSKNRPLIVWGAVAGVTLVVVIIAVALTASGPKPSERASTPAASAPDKEMVIAATPEEKALPTQTQAPAKPAEPPPSQPAPPSAKPAPAVQPRKAIHREIPSGSAHGLVCDYYEHIGGKEIADLRKADTFPDHPNRTVQIGNFELSEGLGSDYGVRVRGFIEVPATGTYRFAVRVDDTCELSLSTDDAQANLRRIVTITHCATKDWAERPDQLSEPCELVKGRRYYVEALMKQGQGLDEFKVAWTSPASSGWSLVGEANLYPWTPESAAGSADATRKQARERRGQALAQARAAVAEQTQRNGSAYRYEEAAQALRASAAASDVPEARALLETAIQRFEALSKLRPFLTGELAKTPAKGVWTAFGGHADVTGASDEGITVAPGRIVAWNKIPPAQMLRLINAVVPQAVSDPTTKGNLLLAAALFCKENGGGLDLALKYRERAVAMCAPLAAKADRVLGGTPDGLKAQTRIEAAREELKRAAEQAEQAAAKAENLRRELGDRLHNVHGLTVEYWDHVNAASLDDARKQDAFKNPPSQVAYLADFETLTNRADHYVARVKGYLVPSETGDYCFYIAADDQGEFWLSSDAAQDKLQLCLKTKNYTGSRQWAKDNIVSKPVRLEKGSRYAVKGLMREGEKSDNFSVAWSPATTNAPTLIRKPNLLCENAAVLPAKAREQKTASEEALQTARTLAAEVAEQWNADKALEEAGTALSSAMAENLQQHAARVKEDAARIQEALARAEDGLRQLKSML